MTTQHLIAGDWGTSNLRLYLCELNGNQTATILDTRFGPGISQISGDFEDKFFNLAQEWIEQYGTPPVLLSGMIGSSIGWKDAPYLTCPVDATQIAGGGMSFSARGLNFSILAGLRTTNPLGAPDVMRGEELQLLGWIQQHQKQNERRLFALPGTHNKWALVKNGRVENFLTAFTGELFGLLRKNSILITDDNLVGFDSDIFMQGVAAIEQAGSADLIHTLFSTRSKQVLGEIASVDALSYLSGMIAAADVLGAIKLFGEFDGITIIGEPALTEQYWMVLNHLGLQAETCNPADIAITGFSLIYDALNKNPRN